MVNDPGLFRTMKEFYDIDSLCSEQSDTSILRIADLS